MEIDLKPLLVFLCDDCCKASPPSFPALRSKAGRFSRSRKGGFAPFAVAIVQIQYVLYEFKKVFQKIKISS